MRSVPDWGRYYLNIAQAVAQRSKDPNTQVGAVLVSPDNRIISVGYNGFPAQVEENAERWDDDIKAHFVNHAELNMVANAARAGVSTLGSTAYLTLAPCVSCARVLIAAGVKEVWFPGLSLAERVKDRPDRKLEHDNALGLLWEAGIETWVAP